MRVRPLSSVCLQGHNWSVNWGGGGEVYIHIFAFFPTNFFWNQLSLELISKEIRRAEREYMNIQLMVLFVTDLYNPFLQISSLLSDIGGQLGLWVGLSLITFAEVGDLFLSFIMLACSKN